MHFDHTSLKKVSNLNSWAFPSAFSFEQALADVDIRFEYIDLESIRKVSRKDRKQKVTEDLVANLHRLTQLNLFDRYEILGTPAKPLGAKVQVTLSTLKKIGDLAFVDYIYIHIIQGAKKKRQIKSAFYCVKMTVVIEIEGVESGLQDVEDRMVIIKAKSEQDALQQLEKTKDEYSKPYLNCDQRLVRWRIESFDDVYETLITNFSDLSSPNGAEVFSKLRSRRLKKEMIWDGH
ncbi:hypothetical protein PBAL39_00747 [Pedobacter sp. BAL39]|uniref:DUF4288 domain-containing protein n=1 Tax=Pedobacter sp. BAL39 TaxID=391596 RepID=UPI0001559D96|nr:DUF4288 domain-containing protein [Pedobacter sp. BAL39]EDM38098.1 hypothetical protein PBAL39_00747 [Pedobacter sp. BAL39]